MVLPCLSGDSVMASSPEYESALREGVRVKTNSVYHLVGDQLVGNTTAHDKVTGPDSVLMLHTIATRVQQ